MSGLMVFLLILAAVLAGVGFMVWKVLKAPLQAPPPEPLQVEPVIEDTSFETAASSAVVQSPQPVHAPLTAARPAEPLVGRPPEPGERRILPRQPVIPATAEDNQLIAKRVALVAGAAAVLPLAFAVPAAMAIAMKQRGRMSGGDECLGYKPGSTLVKEKEVPTLNISVLASGRIEVEGRETALAQLEAQLADLKSRGGKVRYYCEPSDPKPPQALEVMRLLVNQGIPFTSGG